MTARAGALARITRIRPAHARMARLTPKLSRAAFRLGTICLSPLRHGPIVGAFSACPVGILIGMLVVHVEVSARSGTGRGRAGQGSDAGSGGLPAVRALAAGEQRVVRGTTGWQGALVLASGDGPRGFVIGIPNVQSSCHRGAGGGRTGEGSEARPRDLPAVGTLAAGEQCVVGGTIADVEG